jgi:hypothetical protein
MIDTSFKIEDRLSLQKSTFQVEVFDHWREIRGDRIFPDKRDFRPQKFPKFLSQIAMVAVLDGKSYEDRLTGDMIIEVLRLRQNHDRLVAPTDPAIRNVVHSMLDAASLALAPMYFKGRFLPQNANPTDFSALVLPFSHNGMADLLDTVMLAFDFSKHSAIDLHPLEGVSA